jgi:hypothetical protein
MFPSVIGSPGGCLGLAMAPLWVEGGGHTWLGEIPPPRQEGVRNPSPANAQDITPVRIVALQLERPAKEKPSTGLG